MLAYTTRHLGFAGPDAEELVQELWVRLPKLMPSNKRVQDPFTYLICCLQKLGANDRAKEKRHARLLEQQPPAATVDSYLEDRLVACLTAKQLVEQLLDQLLPEDAELLRERFLEDAPIQKIAERLHIPEGTVKSRLHGALNKARVVMGIERPC